jgi:hypothetical protein
LRDSLSNGLSRAVILDEGETNPLEEGVEVHALEDGSRVDDIPVEAALLELDWTHDRMAVLFEHDSAWMGTVTAMELDPMATSS